MDIKNITVGPFRITPELYYKFIRGNEKINRSERFRNLILDDQWQDVAREAIQFIKEKKPEIMASLEAATNNLQRVMNREESDETLELVGQAYMILDDFFTLLSVVNVQATGRKKRGILAFLSLFKRLLKILKT